jgi:hypothetical protein
MLRGNRQLALILRAVRHGDEAAVGTAADRREEAGRLRLLGSAERANPLLHFGLGRALGIVVRRRQLFGSAGDEDGVVIEPPPRPLVDQEFMEPGFAEWRLVLDQGVEHRLVAGPHLFEEERVHHLRGADHVGERFTLVGRQRRDIGGEIRRRKARRLRL